MLTITMMIMKMRQMEWMDGFSISDCRISIRSEYKDCSDHRET